MTITTASPPPRTVVSAANPAWRYETLCLAFSYLTGEQPEEWAASAEELIQAGRLDPEGVLTAWRDGVRIGAMVVDVQPGNAALFYPPAVVVLDTDEPGQAERDEDALMQAAVAFAQRKGAKFAQVTLADNAEGKRLGLPLLRNGFELVTQAISMEKKASPAQLWPLGSGHANVLTLLRADKHVLLFESTYASARLGSLDVPELENVRSMQDLLDAHYGADGTCESVCDPAESWVVKAEGEPVGVIILDGDHLAFLGVVPGQRRKGYGARLLDFVLVNVKTLLVDARNAPALALYRRAGFLAVDVRDLYLNVFGM